MTPTSMNCRKCNADNEIGAKYCRKCGTSLSPENISIMDKFPDFGLQPTTMFNVKRTWSLVFYIAVFLLSIPILILFLFSLFWQEWVDWRSSTINNLICLVAACGFAIVLVAVILSFKSTKIDDDADYVECPHIYRKYKIIVKDSKFGVYNAHKKEVQIPCKFDFLKWRDYGHILTVTEGPDTYDIDIVDNKLR